MSPLEKIYIQLSPSIQRRLGMSRLMSTIEDIIRLQRDQPDETELLKTIRYMYEAPGQAPNDSTEKP